MAPKTPDPPSSTISYVDDVGDGQSSMEDGPPSIVPFPSPVFPIGSSYRPLLRSLYQSGGSNDYTSHLFRAYRPTKPYDKSQYSPVMPPALPVSLPLEPAPTPRKPAPSTASVEDLDLLPRVKGLYRLLDLYSENATGGLVDKIIISQESLKDFIDAIRPGSYKSVTEIDFHTLDLLSFSAVGIYGSKTEIIRFFCDTGAVDDEVRQHLLAPYDTTSTIHAHLRSGIYALTLPNSQQTGGSFNPRPAIYIIYWPEETTWDDDAVGTVRKNRVTFMRYLTRLTDQVRALISFEHSSALAFKEVENESDDDFDDRVFKFEVAKTNEQEEDVVIREGFKVSHHAISTTSATLPSSDGEESKSSSFDPVLLCGETRQVFADRKYVPAQTHEETIDLKQRHDAIYLEDTVDYKGLEILLEDGRLRDRVPELYSKYKDAMRHVETSQRTREADEIRQGESLDTETDDYLHNLRDLYPAVDEAASDASNDQYTTLRAIKSPQYKAMKERFFMLKIVLKKPEKMPESERHEAIATLVSDIAYLSRRNTLNPRTYWNTLLAKLSSSNNRYSSKEYLDRQDEEDPAFICRLASLADEDQAYAPFAVKVCNLAHTSLLDKITSVTDLLVKRIESAQEKAIKERSRRLSFVLASKEIDALRVEYRRLFQEALISQSAQSPLVISLVKKLDPHVEVRGFYQYETEAEVQHRLWALETPEHDMLRLRENQKHRLKPRVLSQPMSTCSLPLTWNLRHIQVLTNGSRKHLLFIIDLPDSVGIWLLPLLGDVSLDKPTRIIPNMKDRRYTLACDEQSRLLAMVISDPDKCLCQLFAIDESFVNLQSRGSPFNLLPWYQDCLPNITVAAFFAGTEELCLVEENGRVRVFSFLAQSFKPGTIRLNSGVSHIQASPDGTALIAIEEGDDGRRLRVFHMASFGHNDNGIVVALPDEFNSATSFTLTSIGERRNIFLLALSPSLQCVHSVAIDITCKETEYQFRVKGDNTQSTASVPTVHNSLIDCFSEVWSRYPVIATIQRETFAGSTRLPQSITFVSEDPNWPFESYFKQMIREFEQLSKKPTESRLDKIVIEAARFEDLERDAPVSSTYKAGEWLAELLCLIPIHIALARDNRFVPLKDGVLDPALERQLLGAEVISIIDAITVGWYESIFNSYMATKPVKVVSSMGEQSVGKSYSLNHLVDSSFAGSAGVWLSVCPTKEALVVALDFEGVHSIERTPQEDMLLVLFNTALSNLVLFRNNFALSRDVAHMFTSFQASTRQFDPASNPKLFKGLLAILIKDVVDGDKREIVKEFSSKFSRIVYAEQADNFITLLHDSQLTVIPWNVIQSREFYTLFSKLKKHLFDQKTTHATAGEFLITLKALMAKLKAQDWGPIDQTIVKHRVAALTNLLLNAFATGHAERDHAVEYLKNLDNQEPIAAADSEAVFYVGKDPQEIDRALSIHLQNWKPDAARHSVEELQEHLKETTALRLAHVQAWFDVNTARFPTDNPDILGLRRLFDETSTALLANIQLCLTECIQCRLRYVKRLPTSVVKPVHLMTRRDANSYVQNAVITKRTNTFVRPENTNPCDLKGVITPNGQTYDCANLCSLPQFVGPSPSSSLRITNDFSIVILNTTNIAARNGFTAPSGVNYVSVTVRSAITSMALPAICCTSAGKHTTAARSASFRGFAKWIPHPSPSSRSIQASTIPFLIRNTPKLPDGYAVHTKADPVHYCEEKCMNCGYFCHLPIGHLQAKHDTAHGSMEHTSWAIEGASDVSIEVQGRKFGAQDSGGPQLCSSVCRNLGRHAHIDYCRNVEGQCQEPESEHIKERMLPNPDRPKDWVSHKVFWARAEHNATTILPARPSYCTLPIFHPPQPTDWQVAGNISYVSADGHSFNCPNPNNVRQAYHVIFVLDKSGSMGNQDRRPLPNQPVTQLITNKNDNRFGAVLSSLYGFWVSKGSGTTGERKDAYSVITFDLGVQTRFANDFDSDPDQLLRRITDIRPEGRTNFDRALRVAQTVMEKHWSMDRSPVVIFLSDGECSFNDKVIRDLCKGAATRG
ncbi:hypothetical protein FRB99_003282 [Tulasnella sp. 403]|nr:hypothetical protein FRB99_003282 [Tulasnella sp. 403]